MYHNSTKFNFIMLLVSICWIPKYGAKFGNVYIVFICWIPKYGSKFDNFYFVFHLLDSELWFKIRQNRK